MNLSKNEAKQCYNYRCVYIIISFINLEKLFFSFIIICMALNFHPIKGND